jgi:Flp pilus assembly protein TadD
MLESLRQLMTKLRSRDTAVVCPAPAADARDDSEYRTRFDAGVAAFAAGRYEEAARHFERCVDRHSGDADAHLNLGLACHRLGRREEAADSYALALAHRPDFAEAHFNLGTLDLERGAGR